MCVAFVAALRKDSSLRDHRADQRRADALEHFRLRALNDRREREHVLLLGDRRFRRRRVNDRRPQVAGPLLLDQPRAVLFGDVRHARRLQVLLDLLPHGGAHARAR